MVPKGWSKFKVGDIFDVQLGKMLNQQAKLQSPQYPYLTNFNVRWGSFVFDDINTMYFSESEKQKYSLKAGDILMCEGGEVGRCAIWNQEIDCFYQKALHRLRAKEHVSPQYFQFYMESIAGSKTIENLTGKTSISHLTQEKLVSLSIVLPPIPEQRKIAKILSTWDKTITTTERLLTNRQQQKKALMQRLLTGKQRFAGFEGEWKKYLQGNVATFHNGRAYKLSEWEETGTPVIRLQNLTGRGSDFYYSNLALPARQYCESGDLLYMWSATFGPHIWQGPKAIYHYHIWKIECSVDVLHKEFMFYVLNFETQRWLSKSNGMGLLHITKETMEKQTILLPSLKEQQKIASVLSATDAEITTIQNQLDNLKQQKKALMQQLLTGKRRVKVDSPALAAQ